MTPNEFIRFRRPYERALRQLVLELEFFLDDVEGVEVYLIDHRLKSFESASQKAVHLNLPITELQDIAGMRVVLATEAQVDVLARLFSRKADSKDLTIRSDARIEKEDGYRARHLVVEFEGHYTRSVQPARVEVQLVTIMQHAFNFVSRAWVYKRDCNLPDSWRADFLAVSADLAGLDKRISRLQTEILNSASAARPDGPLSPFSYQRIVAEVFGETAPLEDSVDSVRFLVDIGCDTNAKLRGFFGRQDIGELRERFLALRTPAGKLVGEWTAGLGLSQFYLTWGTRMEGGEGLLRSLQGEHRENGEK